MVLRKFKSKRQQKIEKGLVKTKMRKQLAEKMTIELN